MYLQLRSRAYRADIRATNLLRTRGVVNCFGKSHSIREGHSAKHVTRDTERGWKAVSLPSVFTA